MKACAQKVFRQYFDYIIKFLSDEFNLSLAILNIRSRSQVHILSRTVVSL